MTARERVNTIRAAFRLSHDAAFLLSYAENRPDLRAALRKLDAARARVQAVIDDPPPGSSSESRRRGF